MTADGGGSRETPPPPAAGAAHEDLPFLQRAARWLPWRLARRLRGLEARVRTLESAAQVARDSLRDDLERRIDRERGEVDGRADRIEARLDAAEAGAADRVDRVEEAMRAVQAALQQLAERQQLAEARLDAGEQGHHARAHRLDAVESDLRDADREIERLRDRVVPAASARFDALLDRLADELEEVGSLVERMLRSEPLPAPVGLDPEVVSDALTGVQPALVEAFRGDEAEIRHRLDRYLSLLGNHPPVLDLGCGRGELLLMLREAGVEARGIESDPALVQAAVRRGLAVTEGDLLEVLPDLPDGGCGAVTAIHVVEHLPPDRLPALFAAIRRILSPGGVLVLESPNVHSLRVGAALYWLDPTHRRPLPPETVELLLRAAGFRISASERLHPFPPDQQLRRADERADHETVPAALAARLDRLEARLDELLNGPRDYSIVAVSDDHE